MNKYLDGAGLGYFWGKVKEYVAEHTGGNAANRTENEIVSLLADVEANEWIAFPIMRFATCKVIGISNVIDPATEERLNFGIMHFYGNMRPTYNFHPQNWGGFPLRFKVGFNPDNGKKFVLNEDFSETSMRMMSFQGRFWSSEAESQPLEGVYADVQISNPEEDPKDYFNVVITPLQTLKADNTYWIDFQLPIAWKWE